MDYNNWINRKLDLFFDKSGKDYLNMDIYTQIFDFMDNSGFKKDEPLLYQAELKRIRDLHNSFVTAFEEGREEGKKKRMKIEIAKNLLKNNITIDIIISSTGLTKEEIEMLKE